MTPDVARDSAGSRAIDQWLDKRSEPAPPTLRVRIAHAVDAVRGNRAQSVADISAHAGAQLLERLLAEGCAARSAAPDLLAADALVTYAFEAAADEENRGARELGERASRTMLDIARLGGEP